MCLCAYGQDTVTFAKMESGYHAGSCYWGPRAGLEVAFYDDVHVCMHDQDAKNVTDRLDKTNQSLI